MAHESETISNEEMTALFAQLVVQQTNLAMMLLGKVAHPESGQVTKTSMQPGFSSTSCKCLRPRPKAT
jgi:hypothetical protein